MVASPAGYVASGGRLPPLPFSSEDLSWSALFNPVNLLEKNILLIHTLHRKMFKCSGISDSASVRLRAESKRPITPRWSRQPWGEPAELYLPKFGHLVLFKMPLSVEPSACSSACQARLWAQHTLNYRATHKSTMAAFVAGLAAGLVEHIPERRSGCWGARNYLWNEATRTCSDFPFCLHCWLSVLHFGLFPLMPANASAPAVVSKLLVVLLQQFASKDKTPHSMVITELLVYPVL